MPNINMRAAAIGFVVLLGLPAPAAAEITITKAHYAGGVLVVAGETSRPNQRVTLDRRFTTRTGRNKNFTFRVAYRPRDCIASIRAGSDVHPAVVANCRPRLRREGRRLKRARTGPEWRLTNPRRNDRAPRRQRSDEIWRERPTGER